MTQTIKSYEFILYLSILSKFFVKKVLHEMKGTLFSLHHTRNHKKMLNFHENDTSGADLELTWGQYTDFGTTNLGAQIQES